MENNLEDNSSYYKEILIKRTAVSATVATVLIAIMNYIGENPSKGTESIFEALDLSPASGYRYFKHLRTAEIITKDNKLNIPKYNRNFNIPTALRQGILVEGNPAVHLIAHLSQYTDQQVPVGWSITKEEILKKIHKHFTDRPDLVHDMVKTLQEALAFVALYQGDTSQWKNMMGVPKPPNSLKELFE